MQCIIYSMIFNLHLHAMLHAPMSKVFLIHHIFPQSTICTHPTIFQCVCATSSPPVLTCNCGSFLNILPSHNIPCFISSITTVREDICAESFKLHVTVLGIGKELAILYWGAYKYKFSAIHHTLAMVSCGLQYRTDTDTVTHC